MDTDSDCVKSKLLQQDDDKNNQISLHIKLLLVAV